jgi:hypothetical protein
MDKKEYKKEYRQKNKKLIQEYRKKYASEHLIPYQQYNMMHNYGITIKQYDEMAKKQNNRCAICNMHQSELKLALCIDHNHNSKEIRELLCHRCNAGLGMFKESKELLRKATEYLEKYTIN